MVLRRVCTTTLLTLCLMGGASFSYADPYTYSGQLLNSANLNRFGEEARFGRRGPDPVDLLLETNAFGQFNGVAKAWADDNDNLKLYASVSLAQYRGGSYQPYPGGGLAFAAAASGYFTDLVSVAVPVVPGQPEVVFRMDVKVTGAFSLTGGLAVPQFCYGMALGAPVVSGTCLPNTPTLSNTLTLVSAPFVPNGDPQALNMSFGTTILVNDARLPVFSTYSASAIADLTNTITLGEVLITDLAGTPIRGVSLQSSNGVAYSLSSQNLSPVPEPSTAWLFLAGGVGLALRRTHARRKAPSLQSAPSQR